MGKKTNTKWYETVVQLLVLSAAVLTPYLAFNLKDLELFSVSKSLWSSINPWLYPPYIYLLINFIIIFIFASSFIHSNTNVLFNPTNNDYNQTFITDSFIDSSLTSHDLPVGSLSDDDVKSHTQEDTFKDVNDDLQSQFHIVEESVVDKRELRKSKTFHEGGSRPINRRERYVRILSQDELDRRVEAFIYRFKKDNKVQ